MDALVKNLARRGTADSTPDRGNNKPVVTDCAGSGFDGVNAVSGGAVISLERLSDRDVLRQVDGGVGQIEISNSAGSQTLDEGKEATEAG